MCVVKLMNKEIESKIPMLYETENISANDKILQVKFFNPFGRGTWYAVEYDPAEKMCFGYIEIFQGEGEWGYFSITELESIRIGPCYAIERDITFKPCTFSELNK